MNILKSFSYALQGLKHCIVTQRNFRFHIVAAVTVLIVSLFYNFSRFEVLSLAATILFVLICEMINTAIEAAIDMHGSEYNINAKIAKDVAAGAVLMSAVFAVAVAVALFWNTAKISLIFRFFASHPLMLLPVAIYAVACVLFVTGVPFKKFNNR